MMRTTGIRALRMGFMGCAQSLLFLETNLGRHRISAGHGIAPRKAGNCREPASFQVKHLIGPRRIKALWAIFEVTRLSLEATPVMTKKSKGWLPSRPPKRAGFPRQTKPFDVVAPVHLRQYCFCVDHSREAQCIVTRPSAQDETYSFRARQKRTCPRFKVLARSRFTSSLI